jgi:hypothetical protein
MANKKVVRVDRKGDDGHGDGRGDGPAWKPTEEAKGKATRLRLVAVALWVLALVVEAVAIFLLLNDDDLNVVLLVALIVVTGALAIPGSLLWKKANRLDPASRHEPVRFFVQNQLGAFIAVVAFLPLVILIVLDKDMSKQDKAIAGGVGAVVMVVAVLFGVDWDPPSTEQYAEEENIVTQVTGENLVFWTKSGSVFHLCEDVPDVNRESQDNTIYSGTVAEAHEDGKDRLTKKWRSEAEVCGFDVPADLEDELDEESSD